MHLPELKDPLTLREYAEACQLLALDPLRTLRDPVGAARRVVSADLRQGQAFLDCVLRRGCGLSLEAMSDDAARMLLGVVFVLFVDQVRRQTRGYASPAGQA